LFGDDFTLENDVHGRCRFSGADQAFAISERTRLGVAAQPLDLGGRQHRKHLVAPGLEGRRLVGFSHGLLLAVAARRYRTACRQRQVAFASHPTCPIAGHQITANSSIVV
jgi:hypothetical protein